MFRVGILTVSDKGHAGERHDASGPELARLLPPEQFAGVAAAVVPDEREAIKAAFQFDPEQSPVRILLRHSYSRLTGLEISSQRDQNIWLRISTRPK